MHVIDLTEAGWIGRDAILMTGINSLFYVVSTLPPWYLMDRAGRRPILLSGALAMAIALTTTGWWIYIDQAITPNAVVVCVVIYNFAFGMSWGPVPWLYPPEIMPLPFRARGVSLSTATVSAPVRVQLIVQNWLFVSVACLNRTDRRITGWASQRPFSKKSLDGGSTPCTLSFAWCLSCWSTSVSCRFLIRPDVSVYPETRGVSLEEMDKLFGDEIVEDVEDDGDDESDVSSRHSDDGPSKPTVSERIGAVFNYRNRNEYNAVQQ